MLSLEIVFMIELFYDVLWRAIKIQMLSWKCRNNGEKVYRLYKNGFPSWIECIIDEVQ